MIGMPPASRWGAMRYVTAGQLLDAVTSMGEAKMYGEMIFYIEACESGSMFNGLLPSNISVWAATAADPFHSSYASKSLAPSPPLLIASGTDAFLYLHYSFRWWWWHLCR